MQNGDVRIMAQSNLRTARNSKKDEFYTRIPEIQAEIGNYKDQFVGKVVFCNCDDPFESNFVKYFLTNFNRLGIKKLIASGYSLSTDRPSCSLQVTTTQSFLGKNQTDLDLCDVNDFLTHEYGKIISPMHGNYALQKERESGVYYEAGDFRSDESIELLKEADIVSGNPPFSKFKEYIKQLIEYNKKFLIIGNINAVTYKEFFPLIKENRVWMGISISSGDRPFYVPDDYPLAAAGCGIDENGRKFIRVKGVRWFTNLDHPKRHQKLPLDLNCRYYGNEALYPKYDNYDAINVDRTCRIPCDYSGIMGVPITFIDKYCPEQFEILGDSRYHDGSTVANDINYIFGKLTYRRLLIRRKQ